MAVNGMGRGAFLLVHLPIEKVYQIPTEGAVQIPAQPVRPHMARHADQVKITGILEIRFNPGHQGRRYPENSSAFGFCCGGIGGRFLLSSAPTAAPAGFLDLGLFGGIRHLDGGRVFRCCRCGFGFCALANAVADAVAGRG